MTFIRALGAACVVALVCAGGAAAQAPVLQTQTVQMAGIPCSVTAWEYFSAASKTFTQQYGGGTSCAASVGIAQKTLDVVPQVFNVVNSEPIWFNLGGYGLYQGPVPISPLRLAGSRPAVPSHLYRNLVYGQVTLSSGKTFVATACSNCTGKPPTLRISQSDINTPFGPQTKPIPGSSCSVTEFGPTFAIVNNGSIMTYSGTVSCNSSATARTLTIGAQVANGYPNTVYHTITGSTLAITGRGLYGLSSYTGRTAYTGHGYRIFATGIVGGKTATATGKTSGP